MTEDKPHKIIQAKTIAENGGILDVSDTWWNPLWKAKEYVKPEFKGKILYLGLGNKESSFTFVRLATPEEIPAEIQSTSQSAQESVGTTQTPSAPPVPPNTHGQMENRRQTLIVRQACLKSAAACSHIDLHAEVETQAKQIIALAEFFVEWVNI